MQNGARLFRLSLRCSYITPPRSHSTAALETQELPIALGYVLKAVLSIDILADGEETLTRTASQQKATPGDDFGKTTSK